MASSPSKRHKESDVERVLSSQSSHNDAKPVQGMKFESYREEWDYLVVKKKDLEAALAGYSKAAFCSAQARCRAKNRGKSQDESFNAWISLKAKMEQDRVELIRKKADVEQRLMQIKPLMKAENLRESREATESKGRGTLDALEDILSELCRIRQLLEPNSVTQGDPCHYSES